MAGFWNGVGNSGLALADTTLGALGANNVIGEKNYLGDNATDWNKGSDIAGKVGGVGLQVAGNIVAPGVGGAVVSSAQGIGNTLNPMEAPQATQPPQPYYNQTNVPVQSYAQSYAYGGYVKGRIRGYAQGDFIPYSSEYTQTEEQSTPFDTTSWSDSYTAQPIPQNYTGQPVFGQPQNFGIPKNNQYTTSSSQPFGEQPVAPVADHTKASGLNPYIAGGTLALGAFQTYMANRGLRNLQKEAMPSYSPTSQLIAANNRAQQMSQRGFTPEQEANFKTNLATTQNTAYNNAVSQSGGNLAQAINAGLKSQNINALNEFAAADASKRQQNIQYADSFANRFQNIKDDNTRNALQYRLMREQALGAGMTQGTQNLATGANAALASLYKG